MTEEFSNYLDLFLDHLRVERGLSANTVEAYGHDISRFLDYARGQNMTGLKSVSRSALMAHMIELSRNGLGARSRGQGSVRAEDLFRLPAP